MQKPWTKILLVINVGSLRGPLNEQLMNEAEYLMKNYEDRGGCWPRRITPSEISIILHMLRKPNSIIILLFIQNNS